MGSASSRNVVQSVANVSAESTNSAIQTVAASARSFQAINVAGVAKDVTIRNVRMDGNVELSVDAYLEATQTNEVQQKIAQQMEQMAKASVSGINLGNSSSTSNSVNTNINAVVRSSNMTSQQCDTEAMASQVINAADIGGSLLVENVDMSSAVKALINCRMQAVLGNTSVQDLQQTVKQTAISETVGLDLAALIWVIVGIVAVIGIVVGISMLIAYKASTGPIAYTVKLLVPALILAAAVYGIFLLLSNLDPVQAPAGVAPEDNILQYPFLRREVVAEECAPAVFEGRTQFATPVTNARQLADWVKAYNARVDAHEARLAVAGAAAAAAQIVPPAEVGEGPAEDAPLTRRWLHVKIAHINPRTGQVSCYAGEPPNHLRGWSQWGPSETPVDPAAEAFGPNVYRANPKFEDPTRVAIVNRLGEALGLLEFLRCAEARPPLEKFRVEAAGWQACAAEIAAFHKTLKDSGAWERDGWEAKQARRFVPDSRINERDINPRALWTMLTGTAPGGALAANALDAASLPDGINEANMREDRFAVQVDEIVPGVSGRVLPLVRQLAAVRNAVAAEQGVSPSVIAHWDSRFNEWKRRMEAGYDRFDAGSPGDEASWRNVTLAFVSRLDRVTTLSVNPSSPKPVFVNVTIWLGVLGGVGLLFAVGAFAFISRQQRKGRAKEEYEEAKRKAELQQIATGGGGGGPDQGLMARMRSLLFMR